MEVRAGQAGRFDWVGVLRRPFFLLLLAMVTALGGCGGKGSETPAMADVSNLDQARKFFIGTWTFTQPLDQVYSTGSIFQWERWVVRPDGVVEQYEASPRDNDWGKPTLWKYTVITDKYADDGQRYFAIRLGDSHLVGIMSGDDALDFHFHKDTVTMVRGEKFPFSK